MLFKCSVCNGKLDLKRADDVYKIPCAHVFHKQCMDSTIAFKEECPQCSTVVTNDNIKKLIVNNDCVYDWSSLETKRLIAETGTKKTRFKKLVEKNLDAGKGKETA